MHSCNVNEGKLFFLKTFIGECQCDSGDAGTSCPLSGSNNPQIVVTDFDTTSNAIPFPVTYGATLSTECGVLSSGRSLVFK